MSQNEPTRGAVLDLIVEKGPITASRLARILGLTTAAVRRHLIALEEAGQITPRESVGPARPTRGRPARHYIATGKGHQGMSSDYSELASKAIGYLEQVAGAEAVNNFAAARSRDIERRYAPIVKAAGQDPRARARALADALTADGYAATVREVGFGNFTVQLCQGHCPVQEVAGAYPQLCEAETQAFSRLLNVHVQRLATLAKGGHVCTTSVPLGLPTNVARIAAQGKKQPLRVSKVQQASAAARSQASGAVKPGDQSARLGPVAPRSDEKTP